jgi:2-aminoadipate transaminase
MKVRFSQLGLRQKPSEITRLMALAIQRPDMLSLAAGFTDSESLPVGDVREIVEEISDLEAEAKAALQYGPNIGRDALRSSLAQRMAGSDSVADEAYQPENLFVTNGSQQALYLAVQTLCDPGDYILVEQPTYFVFMEILQGLGLKPLPMPMDDRGDVDVEALRTMLQQVAADGSIEKVKAVYLVSYFANPSGHSLSQESKVALGSLLREFDSPIAVLEDAAYRELYFEDAHPAKSVLSLEPFSDLPVLYTSTLTKPYASGLKVGYAYSNSPEWRDVMLTVKGQQDFGTSHFTQAVVERALLSGRFDRHLSELRRTYQRKMMALHEGLADTLLELGWSWDVPEGGLYLWMKSPKGLPTHNDSEFHRACLKSGVFYVPGDLCFVNEAHATDYIRASFGVLNEDQLGEAAKRFNEAALSVFRDAVL